MYVLGHFWDGLIVVQIDLPLRCYCVVDLLSFFFFPLILLLCFLNGQREGEGERERVTEYTILVDVDDK